MYDNDYAKLAPEKKNTLLYYASEPSLKGCLGCIPARKCVAVLIKASDACDRQTIYYQPLSLSLSLTAVVVRPV